MKDSPFRFMFFDGNTHILRVGDPVPSGFMPTLSPKEFLEDPNNTLEQREASVWLRLWLDQAPLVALYQHPWDLSIDSSGVFIRPVTFQTDVANNKGELQHDKITLKHYERFIRGLEWGGEFPHPTRSGRAIRGLESKHICFTSVADIADLNALVQKKFPNFVPLESKAQQ